MENEKYFEESIFWKTLMFYEEEWIKFYEENFEIYLGKLAILNLETSVQGLDQLFHHFVPFSSDFPRICAPEARKTEYTYVRKLWKPWKAVHGAPICLITRAHGRELKVKQRLCTRVLRIKLGELLIHFFVP